MARKNGYIIKSTRRKAGSSILHLTSESNIVTKLSCKGTSLVDTNEVSDSQYNAHCIRLKQSQVGHCRFKQVGAELSQAQP